MSPGVGGPEFFGFKTFLIYSVGLLKYKFFAFFLNENDVNADQHISFIPIAIGKRSKDMLRVSSFLNYEISKIVSLLKRKNVIRAQWFQGRIKYARKQINIHFKHLN